MDCIDTRLGCYNSVLHVWTTLLFTLPTNIVRFVAVWFLQGLLSYIRMLFIFIVEVLLDIKMLIVDYIILKTFKTTVEGQTQLNTCCVIRSKLPLSFEYPKQKKIKIAI